MRNANRSTAARDLERLFRGRSARRNRSRRDGQEARARRRDRLYAVVGAAAVAGFALGAGLFFLLVHDLLTRGEFFPARQIVVSGAERLTVHEILAAAGVQSGMNLLGLNLSAAQRRLIAHPWIREAEVRREIPSGLHIRVREHRAIARVALGGGFLLNREGEIFKEAEPGDPEGLPEIEGLPVEELRLADRSAAAPFSPRRWLLSPPPEEPQARGRSLSAVMAFLAQAAAAGEVLPPGAIRRIRVDRQLGLTVLLHEGGRAIDFGWDGYDRKLERLAEIQRFFRAHPEMAPFQRLDFTDPQRVLVGLETPPAAGRPQPSPGG
ncbi:MAG: FtsQ-type POTRA domain-containing protein [Desulfobacterales bacterium]